MSLSHLFSTSIRRLSKVSLRQVSVGLIDQGVVSVANFLTVVLLARHLPLAEFGIFMLAQTILVLLTSLQNALVAQPHNIFGAQRQGLAYSRLTLVLGAVQLVGSSVIALFIGLLAYIFSFLHSGTAAQLPQLLCALALTIVPWMSQEFIRRVLYTQGEIARAAVNNLISYGLQLIGILYLALSANTAIATPANAMLILGGSSLLAAMFGLFQLHDRISLRIARQLPELRSFKLFIASFAETWRISKWLVAQQGINWLGAGGHGWLVTLLMGPASFGIYRAAYQIVNILNPLRQAATNHLPARAGAVLAGSTDAEGSAALIAWGKRTALALTIPFTLCALAVSIFSNPLLKIVYGHALPIDNMQTLVMLGALAYAINFIRTPMEYAALLNGNGRRLFVRTLVSTAFVLTAGSLLIWRFGIYGAMASEIATAIIVTVLTLRIFLHRVQKKTLAARTNGISLTPKLEITSNERLVSQRS